MPTPRVSGSFPVPVAPTLAQRIRRFWDPPDDFLLDAGKAGELLIARIRLGVLLVLLMIPLSNLALGSASERETHITGFFVTLFATAVAALVYLLVARDRRQRWLPLATSTLDVTLISIALLSFAFTIDPLQSVNSLVTFDTYFLAIAGACLRYDRRVALLAGSVAVIQYLAIVLIVAALLHGGQTEADVTRYGRFVVSDQVSRMINLALATALAVSIVRAMQAQRELSTGDALTGLFNRRFFDDYFATEVERAARYDAPFAVAMVDVDHFKQFNDRYGHATGDRALRYVARVLQRAVRRSDLVARYGGEEFVVVLRETGAAEALERVQEIRRAVEAEPLVVARGTGAANVTVSIGVASWPADGRVTTDLLQLADQRLFEAKTSGRNRVIGPEPRPPRPP